MILTEDQSEELFLVEDDSGLTLPAGMLPIGPANTVLTVNNAGTAYEYRSTSQLGLQFASSLVDISDGGQTIIDIVSGFIIITATSKPANPQFEYTVLAGDMPSHPRVVNYAARFGVTGQNTDTVAHTMNGQMTIDGVETDTVRSAVIESGEYYCFTGMYAANAIAAGSKVGFKLWCSDAPDLFDIGYGNVYIFARTYNFIDVLLFFRTLSQFNDAFYQIALTGTIPEVTYQEGYLLGLQQRDRGVTNDYQGIGVGDHTFLSGQNDLASFAITQGDIINYFNSQPAPTLEKVLCPRYFRINTIG